MEHKAYEQFSDQWLGPIRCCIRAGVDMACGGMIGVLGFTAGDLRKMFPEGVPDWVFPPDECTVNFWSNKPTGRTFSELPDNAGVAR